jgi:hypothetical protein
LLKNNGISKEKINIRKRKKKRGKKTKEKEKEKEKEDTNPIIRISNKWPPSFEHPRVPFAICYTF